MEFLLKQKAFSWGDKFTVFDRDGNDAYYVKGEVFTLGKKLHVTDLSGTEVAFIHQKVWSFMPRFFVDVNGETVMEIKREFTLMKPVYNVSGRLGEWTVKGDFFAHEYSVESPNGQIANISKRILTWGDTYDIVIADDVDPLVVLCLVLAVDASVASQNN